MSLDGPSKLAIAKEKKDLGDQAFKTGELTDGELVSPHCLGRGLELRAVPFSFKGIS